MRQAFLPGTKQGPTCTWMRWIYKGVRGAILTYFNPPVHQVGNPGLDAYHQGLDRIREREGSLKFLILYRSNDPVHAGGDLKESLTNLDRTLEIKKAKEEAGAGQRRSITFINGPTTG